MLSFGIARRTVALPCLSTRTRSDRHFPDLAGACARGGRGNPKGEGTTPSTMFKSGWTCALAAKQCERHLQKGAEGAGIVNGVSSATQKGLITGHG